MYYLILCLRNCTREMAVRASKRDLLTGNTIRAVGARRRAEYMAQPVITKFVNTGVMELGEDVQDGFLFHCPLPQPVFMSKSRHNPKVRLSTDEAIDEGGLCDPQVTYSLNKRQRWLLPDLLKFGISGKSHGKWLMQTSSNA